MARIAPAGGVRLVNRTTSPLEVEVRLATPTGCDGRILSKQVIAPSSTTVIRSSHAMCVRRESLGARGARGRGNWERKETSNGTIAEVVL